MTIWTIRRATLVLALVGLLASPGVNLADEAAHVSRSSSAARGPIVGTPGVGQPGVTRSVKELMSRYDPLARESAPTVVLDEEDDEEREGRRPTPVSPNPLSPRASAWPASSSGPPQGDSPLSVGASFRAVVANESFFVPPDSTGDVGPTQVLVMVNGYIRVFDKAGNPGALQMPTALFWSGVPESSYVTDPQVVYDRTSERWYLAMITFTGSFSENQLLLAVSSASEITENSTFTFYQFEPDDFSTAPNEDSGAFADYPSLGVDNNAVYLSANMYRPDFRPYGPSVFVIRKSSLLAGGPMVATPFRQISTFDTGGIASPRGVSNDDPEATVGYFVGHDLKSYGTLNLRRVIDPGGTPSLSPDIPITVPTTAQVITVPFQGSRSPISAGGISLVGAGLFRNRITGEQSLWTSHVTLVDAAGVGTYEGDRAAARWYEIIDLSTAPAIRQIGTVFDPKPSRPRNYIYGSVAMSGQGHAVIGTTSGGRDNRAEVSVAARLADDTPGTIRMPEAIVVSAFDYNAQSGVTAQRWGDYSRTVVDPTDGMTFWTFQEYCDGPASWAVRVVEVKAPPPPAIAALSPATAAVGTRVECVATGVAADSSGYFDPGAGYSKRLAVLVGGGGVAVENVRLVDSRSIAFDLVFTPDAVTGPRDVTVVNPDGQSVVAVSALSVGPRVTQVRVQPTQNGSGKLVIKGDGFTNAVTLFVDSVAFVSPARSKGGTKVVQTGRLSNGSSINQAARPGTTVMITVVNSTGGTTRIPFTR